MMHFQLSKCYPYYMYSGTRTYNDPVNAAASFLRQLYSGENKNSVSHFLSICMISIDLMLDGKNAVIIKTL